MKTTAKTEMRLELENGDCEPIVLIAEYSPGSSPREVHLRVNGIGHTFGVEDILRAADAIKRAGWVPEGHYVCADHGLYDARSSDNARCSRCEVAS